MTMTRITLTILALCLTVSSAVAAPKAKPQTAPIAEVALLGTNLRQYTVLVLLNQTLPITALIDTGATDCYIPYETYVELVRNGTIVDARDTLPPITYTLAGGSPYVASRVRLTLTLGTWRIPNVIATIGSKGGGHMLLGSNVLQRFQSFGIDHTRGILRLGQPQ